MLSGSFKVSPLSLSVSLKTWGSRDCESIFQIIDEFFCDNKVINWQICAHIYWDSFVIVIREINPGLPVYLFLNILLIEDWEKHSNQSIDQVSTPGAVIPFIYYRNVRMIKCLSLKKNRSSMKSDFISNLSIFLFDMDHKDICSVTSSVSNPLSTYLLPCTII